MPQLDYLREVLAHVGKAECAKLEERGITAHIYYEGWFFVFHLCFIFLCFIKDVHFFCVFDLPSFFFFLFSLFSISEKVPDETFSVYGLLGERVGSVVNNVLSIDDVDKVPKESAAGDVFLCTSSERASRFYDKKPGEKGSDKDSDSKYVLTSFHFIFSCFLNNQNLSISNYLIISISNIFS